MNTKIKDFTDEDARELRVILKRGINWNEKYGFYDVIPSFIKRKLIKQKYIGRAVITLQGTIRYGWRANIWDFIETQNTKDFLKELVDNGDAKVVPNSCKEKHF